MRRARPKAQTPGAARLRTRLAWLVLLWAGGVAALLFVAGLLHWVLRL